MIRTFFLAVYFMVGLNISPILVNGDSDIEKLLTATLWPVPTMHMVVTHLKASEAKQGEAG